MTPLLVALGAALGAPARYLLGHHFDRRLPWGTLAATLVACLLAVLLAQQFVSVEAQREFEADEGDE